MRIVISQPMRGLTRGVIEANRAAVVKELEAQGHTILNTFLFTAPEGANEGLYCLGESFRRIAEADAVYFMDGWQDTRGCWMEFEACKRYGVPTLNV